MKGCGHIGVIGLVLVGLVAGCATMIETKPTLYERIVIRQSMPGGLDLTFRGRDAIAAIVDDFVANVVADNRINARFKGLKPPEVTKLKANLADQICDATGGPCAYLGRDMTATHKGMKITEAEWNATVEALVKALDKRKVPEAEKAEMLGLLGPMKKDIVGQ